MPYELQIGETGSMSIELPVVKILLVSPETRLYNRLKKEGRLESQSTGNNTDAVLNFRPRLNRDFLINGYRMLMNKLYEPRTYNRRVRVFLEHNRPRGPRQKFSRSEVQAFFISLWVLGVRNRGQFSFWKLCATTLFRQPRQFYLAVEFAITGYHFRRIAKSL